MVEDNENYILKAAIGGSSCAIAGSILNPVDVVKVCSNFYVTKECNDFFIRSGKQLVENDVSIN